MFTALLLAASLLPLVAMVGSLAALARLRAGRQAQEARVGER